MLDFFPDMNQQNPNKPVEPMFPTPAVLPMEGGYKMGICTTQHKIMLWAHDGNDAAVRKYIEKFFPNVPKKEVAMHILDMAPDAQKT